MNNDSVQIGHHILELARKNKITDPTPLKLIKLTYLAHGWMLGLYGQPLATDDVEAWPYGPVFKRLYLAVKKYKNNEVENIAVSSPAKFDRREADIIRQVIEIYGKKDGIFLSALTHQDGTPWSRTWDEYGKNAVIPQEWIEEHFRDKAEQNVA